MTLPVLRREGVLTSAWYAAAFFAFGAHLPYWPVWLAHWGLSDAEIGSYLGLALATRVIGATALPALADRFAIRRPLIAACAVAVAAIFLAHLAIGTRPALLVATLAASFAMAPLGPLGEALGVRAAGMHSFPYAHARAAGSAAFLAMNVAMGALIGWTGPDAVLWAVVAAMLAVAVLGLRHPGGGAPPGAGIDQSKLREALGLLAQPVFLVFALATSVAQASHAVFYIYGTLTWAAQGIATSTIGLLWAMAVVAEIAMMLGPGRGLVARLGPARALALGAAAAMLRWALMSLDLPVAALWPVQALHAFTFSVAHLGAMGFVAAAIPPRLQASAQGLYAGAIGGGAFALAALGAASISAAWGAAAAYWMAAGMAAVSVLAALALGRVWHGGLLAGKPG